MQLLKDNLLKDEKIIYQAKPHWIIYSPTIIWLIVCIPAYLSKGANGSGSIMLFGHHIFMTLIFIALIIAILYFLSGFISYVTSDFVITNKRILMQTGLLRRTSLEISFNKIESIYVTQPIMGRIFNFGTICVTGTGGTTDTFTNVPIPYKFRTKIEEQIEISGK